MHKRKSRGLAAIALLLLVGAANLGIVARLYGQGQGGQSLFIATRVWILLLPLLWVWRIERGRIQLTRPSYRELQAGLWLGLGMFGAIYGGYLLLDQRWLDPTLVQARAEAVGLLNPWLFLAFAIYFTFGNALVEEYIWRWFAYRQCEILVPGFAAAVLAAACFTLHHIVALLGFTGSWSVTLLGSLGVFVAGLVWSACYLIYRSLWACYISHLLADLVIAIIAWQLLFG
ncbi:MAG: CPBP family intramembrane glutamic endopeptidase [Leptolyngbyaceae cyanobacterium]